MTSIQPFKAPGLLLVAFLALSPAPAGAQCGELTWLEAINQALDANQALVAARQTLEAQHKDVAKARATMLPDLVFGALGQMSKEATFSSVAGVIPERVIKGAGEISETLYNHAYIDQLGAQKHTYVGQQETYQDTRNQTIAAVGQDYVGVLLAEALMALQQQNVELSESSLELTQAQESAGEVPYSNVLRMQSQLYGAEQSMVAQKSSVLQSRFQFNQVRNRPSRGGVHPRAARRSKRTASSLRVRSSAKRFWTKRALRASGTTWSTSASRDLPSSEASRLSSWRSGAG